MYNTRLLFSNFLSFIPVGKMDVKLRAVLDWFYISASYLLSALLIVRKQNTERSKVYRTLSVEVLKLWRLIRKLIIKTLLLINNSIFYLSFKNFNHNPKIMEICCGDELLDKSKFECCGGESRPRMTGKRCCNNKESFVDYSTSSDEKCCKGKRF